MAAAAAVVAITTLLNGPSWDLTAPAALAVLEELHGDVYVIGTAGRAAQAGQELFAGHELGTSGDESSATIKYADNTRLELGADTRVSFEGKSGQRVVLEEGVLTGDRPGLADGPPMVLATRHAEAQVSGTHFCLAAAPDSTLVQMDDGRAASRARATARPLTCRPDRSSSPRASRSSPGRSARA